MRVPLESVTGWWLEGAEPIEEEDSAPAFAAMFG